MFKRQSQRFSRELKAGFQVETEAQQVAVAPALPAPMGRLPRRERAARRTTESGSVSGGIIREQCGGGYRVRRVSSSY